MYIGLAHIIWCILFLQVAYIVWILIFDTDTANRRLPKHPNRLRNVKATEYIVSFAKQMKNYILDLLCFEILSRNTISRIF